MTLINRLQAFLQNEFSSLENKRLGLAVSGGVDSMALLWLTRQVVGDFDLKLYVLHFNHCLQARAKEASEVVYKYCENQDIDFIGGARFANKKQGNNRRGLEARARRARFDWMEQVYESLHLDGLLFAHHRDDQVETILLNLGRGSGLFGLRGMEKRTTTAGGCLLLRPLLDVRGTQLETVVEENDLPVVEDPTNSELKQARNRLRHRVIPEWRKAQPDPETAIYNLGERVSRENSFWERYLEDNFDCWRWPDETQIDLAVYREEHRAARLRFLHRITRRFSGGRGFSEKNYLILDSFFVDGNSGKKIDLPGQLAAIVEYKRGSIYRPAEENFSPLKNIPEIPAVISWRGGDKIFVGDVNFERQNTGLIAKSYLHYSLVKKSTVRTFRPGDKLVKNETEIKVKNLFQEKRIPYRARSFWPLVEAGGKVVSVPGFERPGRAENDEQIKISYTCFSPCVAQMKEE
ncbi:MAG: tRNA lysidine(34) synthetase TilS [bacterium]